MIYFIIALGTVAGYAPHAMAQELNFARGVSAKAIEQLPEAPAGTPEAIPDAPPAPDEDSAAAAVPEKGQSGHSSISTLSQYPQPGTNSKIATESVGSTRKCKFESEEINASTGTKETKFHIQELQEKPVRFVPGSHVSGGTEGQVINFSVLTDKAEMKAIFDKLMKHNDSQVAAGMQPVPMTDANTKRLLGLTVIQMTTVTSIKAFNLDGGPEYGQDTYFYLFFENEKQLGGSFTSMQGLFSGSVGTCVPVD